MLRTFFICKKMQKHIYGIFFTNFQYFTKLLTLKMYHLIDKSYTLLLYQYHAIILCSVTSMHYLNLNILPFFIFSSIFIFILLAVHLYTNIKELTLKFLMIKILLLLLL